MTDAVLLRDLLARLRDNVSVLKADAGLPLEQLQADRHLLWAVLFGLLNSAQIMIDVAAHLAADRQRRWESNAELMSILVELGVLSPGLGAKAVEIARFRNLVVHLYVRIEPPRVHAILANDLADFELFAAEVTAYLDSDQD